jgi:hypothetical protein
LSYSKLNTNKILKNIKNILILIVSFILLLNFYIFQCYCDIYFVMCHPTSITIEMLWYEWNLLVNWSVMIWVEFAYKFQVCIQLIMDRVMRNVWWSSDQVQLRWPIICTCNSHFWDTTELAQLKWLSQYRAFYCCSSLTYASSPKYPFL